MSNLEQDIPTKRVLAAPLRSFVLILLFVGGLAAFFTSDFSPFAQSSTQLTASDGYQYIADVDLWHRTNRETEVNAVSQFDLTHDLNDVPMEIGDWRGENHPETNVEVMILLDPEQYVQRLYWNSQGQHMWLTMIGGRSSQPFHPPDICYDVDGWNYNLSSVPIELDGGGRIYGMWMEAQKQLPEYDTPTDHIVFYFYLFPERTRQYQDGIVLFKLTSARYGDLDNTLAVHTDFLRNFFTEAATGTP
ncbi:MAG: exosortase-associated EpsI family protein [Litorilinea sp.]